MKPRIQETPFKTRYGIFRLVAFEFDADVCHVALVKGSERGQEPVLLRVQSSCLTGTALGAVLCDCPQQLDSAIQAIALEGEGCVMYLQQEGRGHGLLEKVAQLREAAGGADTVDAALAHGVPPDIRQYAAAAEMFRMLFGDRAVRLLTNNPEKIKGIQAAGLKVHERIPIEVEPTPDNRAYLLTKKVRMGHLLSKV